MGIFWKAYHHRRRPKPLSPKSQRLSSSSSQSSSSLSLLVSPMSTATKTTTSGVSRHLSSTDHHDKKTAKSDFTHQSSSDLRKNGDCDFFNTSSSSSNTTITGGMSYYNQVSGAAIAARVVTVNATSRPSTNPPLNDHVSDNHDVELILDVFFIFVSGIFIIVGLIVVAYAAVIVFDRYCGCLHMLYLTDWDDEDLFFGDEAGDFAADDQANAPSAEAFGPVAYKARLWGLTPSERSAILEQVFAKHTTTYNTNHNNIVPSGKTPNNEHSSVSPQNHTGEKEQRRLEAGPIPNLVSSSSTMSSSDDSIQETTSADRSDLEEGTKEVPSYSFSSGTSNRRSSTQIDATMGEVPVYEATIVEKRTEDVSESSSDSVFLNEMRLTTLCAICLSEYAEGDRVLRGLRCSHLYHYDCIMPWLEIRNDHCPYCRVELLTPRHMLRAAVRVLDKQRFGQLWCGNRKTIANHERTTTTSRSPPASSTAPDSPSVVVNRNSDSGLSGEESRGGENPPNEDYREQQPELSAPDEPSIPAFSEQMQVGGIVTAPATVPAGETQRSDRQSVLPITHEVRGGSQRNHIESESGTFDHGLAFVIET